MRHRPRFPVVLLYVCIIALSAFGIVMLYSVTADAFGERYLAQQAKWLLIGVIAASGLYFGDYRKLAKWSPWLLGAVALPLVYLALLHIFDRLHIARDVMRHAPLVPGAINGSYRWLKIGPYSLQPSEFAKLAIMLFLAQYYGAKERSADAFGRGLFRPLLWVGPVIVAVLLGGSLSVTFITCAVVMAMFLLAGVRLRYLLLPILAGAIMVGVTLKVSPERVRRLTTFRQPELYADDEGYQLWTSLKALGSGGWLGVGPNQSRMKEFYLPEAHTDFILAVAGEELGYVALVAVALTYLALLAAGFLIAATAVDRVGIMLGYAVAVSIGMHAFVNLGVVSGFLPTTGITAPFISYGGSSMLSTWIGIGLLLSIDRIAQRATVEEVLHSPATDMPLKPVFQQ